MRWGTSPGHGNPVPSCGKAVPGMGLQPGQWGASPGDRDAAPRGGEPCSCCPRSWAPPGREPSACAAPAAQLPPPTHRSAGGCLGAPVPQTISGRRTALQLCRELFEGEQREQRTHLELGAGTEGRCPLRKQGQTSRTCLVTPLSPCSWSRQFSNPPQCSNSSSSPAPGNARRAGSWGLPPLLAPGPSESWSPGVQHAGLCWPQLLLPFPCLLAWEQDTAVWAAAGN